MIQEKPRYQLTKYFGGLPRLREYYFTSFGNLFNNRILIFNIHIMTQKKLYSCKKWKNDAVFTNDFEFHMLRLETYSDQADWILTDIDNSLSGNPYFDIPK